MFGRIGQPARLSLKRAKAKGWRAAHRCSDVGFVGDPSRRAPGQRAREIVRRMRLRALLTLGALAVGTAYLGRSLGLHDPIFLTAEVILLVAILVIWRSVLPLVDRHERGATGEEQVGNLLEELKGAGWRVIHDANFGRGDVDHLLIGSAGLFAVETKSHPGPIKVRSIHGGTLEQVRSEQRAIERITGEAVEPLLVYSRAWVDRPLACRKGVRIVPAGMLVPYLQRHVATLSAEEIGRADRRVINALNAMRRTPGGAASKTRPGSRPRSGVARRRASHGRR
jgi:hypothetical protein